jgi:hypothetical protein
LFDDTYTYSKGRSVHREWVGKAKRGFSKLSILPYWNDYWKNLVKTTHYDDLIEAALRNTEKDVLFLRQNRISAEMREVLVNEYNKIGYMHGNVHIMPLNNIEDKQLQKTLFEVLETAANETIMTPGLGDIPRWLNHSKGRALTQYKAFVFAQTNNLLLPMILEQERRGRIPAYLATALSLGTITAAAKRKLRGQEIDDDGFWKEAVQYSGITGYLYDIYDIGDRIINRRAHWLDAVSPQTSAISDVFDVTKATISNKKMTESQLKKASRLLPFNNLFYLRPIIDYGIHEYSASTGRRLTKRRSSKWQ